MDTWRNNSCLIISKSKALKNQCAVQNGSLTLSTSFVQHIFDPGKYLGYAAGKAQKLVSFIFSNS